MSSEKLVIVSGDGHAEPPAEVWKDYLESKYHEHLPTAIEDSTLFVNLLSVFSDFKTFKPEMLEVIDTDGAWESGGSLGAVGDVDRRIVEMDREGIAAEMVYWGNTSALHPFAPSFRVISQELKAAGSRLYHRWAADRFGSAVDRFYLVGDPGAGVDIDAMVAELHWTADRGFKGAFLPKFFVRTDIPDLYDEYFDPFWAACVERGMFVACHAGHGSYDREMAERLEEAQEMMKDTGAEDLLDQLNNHTKDFFHRSLEPPRALWQMMLGGVFDRFPDLRFVLTEVRGDWMPSILRHLDATFDQANGDLPSKRRPGEYWLSNCLQSLSFMHKCEVPMRNEIGINNITFGRDYPHPEGTWPNTRQWLRDAFAGVPENDLRLILGENAIHMLNLDRAELTAIAERVGLGVEDVLGPGPEIDPRMIESWDSRSGYLKPAEDADDKAIEALLDADRGLRVGAR
jgi:predicted TIM-barrel fold metal-dependent hydrolase